MKLILKSLLILSLLTLNSCGPNIPEEFDAIVLDYTGSSVAPEYHRSYQIVLRSNKVKLLIESYGTVLVDTLLTSTTEQFESIATEIKSIENFGKLETCPDCDGASTTYFRLLNGKQKAFELVWNGADLSNEFKSVLSHIKESIPTFEALLSTPLPEGK